MGKFYFLTFWMQLWGVVLLAMAMFFYFSGSITNMLSILNKYHEMIEAIGVLGSVLIAVGVIGMYIYAWHSVVAKFEDQSFFQNVVSILAAIYLANFYGCYLYLKDKNRAGKMSKWH